jgi:hypothetical protein
VKLEDTREVYTLQQAVDRARGEIAEAVKAVEERDKNRSKARTAAPATKPDAKSSDNKVEETTPVLAEALTGRLRSQGNDHISKVPGDAVNPGFHGLK